MTPTGAGAVNDRITITGTSGSLSHTITVPVSISAAPVPPSLTFSGSQTLTAGVGGSAIFSLGITGSTGWTGPVSIHTFNAAQGYDWCPLGANGTCTSSPIAGSYIVVTPPATIFFRVTDLQLKPVGSQAIFQPTITSPGTPRATGVYFTFSTVQGTVPPNYTLSTPTQITVPVGGTMTSPVSITQQGSYSGTVNVSGTNGIASFPSSQLTLNASTPSAQTVATFSAGALAPGIYSENIRVDALHSQNVQVNILPSSTNSSSTISFSGTAASVSNDSTPVSYTLPFSYGYADKLYSACSVPAPQKYGITIQRLAPTVKGCAPNNSTTCQVPFTASADGSIPAGTYNITCQYDDTTVNGPHAVGTACSQGLSALCISAGTLRVSDATPVITSITPSTVNSGTTTLISISGHNFGSHPTVNIAGINYPTSGTISLSNAQTVVVSFTDPGNPVGTILPVYLTSNGENALAFQAGSGASSRSNTVNLTVTRSCTLPRVSIAGLASGQKVFWSSQSIDSNFRRFYISPVRADAAPVGGTYSWTFDNGNLLRWTDNGSVDANGKNSGSTDANNRNTVNLGIQELSDDNRHPTLGRTGTITVRYETPCGAATDTVTVVLTEAIQIFAYVDGIKIDQDSYDSTSPSFLNRALYDSNLSTYRDYAALKDTFLLGMGNAISCVSNLLGWRDRGQDVAFVSSYIDINTEAGRRYANYFLNSRTANTNDATSNIAPIYGDPDNLASQETFFVFTTGFRPHFSLPEDKSRIYRHYRVFTPQVRV